jgi:hypothetical protein
MAGGQITFLRRKTMKRLTMILMMLFAMTFSFANPSMAGANMCHDNCVKCADACTKAAKSLKGKKGDAALIKTLQDCAKACKTYNGNGTKAQEKVCAEACKTCLEACEKANDKSLAKCISICKDCASCCTD